MKPTKIVKVWETMTFLSRISLKRLIQHGWKLVASNSFDLILKSLIHTVVVIFHISTRGFSIKHLLRYGCKIY